MNGPVASTRQDDTREVIGIPVYLWQPPAWEAGERPPLMDPERPMLRISPESLHPKPERPAIDLLLPTDGLPHQHGDHPPPMGATIVEFEGAVRDLCAEASGQIDEGYLREHVRKHCESKNLRVNDPESAVNFVYLQLLFDRIVLDVCALLRGIRDAYERREPVDYGRAREAYLDYVRGLDHRRPHEPALGNPIQWVDIVPYVPDTDACGPIQGVRLVVHWNPHSSSSGVSLTAA